LPFCVVALLIIPFASSFVSRFLPSAALLCNASGKQTYLSKDYVDTVVQRAFNSLSEAMSMPGADFKHKSAIEEVRRIAKKLRAQADGDPNARYILFRVSELEQQVWLEENDIDFQKNRESQKAKNACIDTFNIELGKKRPDFATLVRLSSRVESLGDAQKADEMRLSRDQRKTNMSRELLYRFQKSFVNGDVDTVRRDLEYCSHNRKYLAFSDSTFDGFSKRIRLQSEALAKKPGLEIDLKRGWDFLAQNRIGEAWVKISSSRETLDQIKGNLPLSDWNSLNSKSKSLSLAASRKDDSLVSLVVALYAEKGEDAALACIANVLKKYGVPEEKVAAASDYVLSHGAKAPGRDSAISAEVDALSLAKSGTEMSIDDIRQRAKEKARAKADSIRATDEKHAETLVLNVYSMLELGRIDDAFTAFNSNLVLLETYVNKEALSSLSSTVSQAYGQWRDEKAAHSQTANFVAPSTIADDLKVNREKAATHLSRIYTLLEQGNVREAYDHFSKYREKLKQYVCKDAFDLVESAVTQRLASVQGKAK